MEVHEEADATFATESTISARIRFVAASGSSTPRQSPSLTYRSSPMDRQALFPSLLAYWLIGGIGPTREERKERPTPSTRLIRSTLV